MNDEAGTGETASDLAHDPEAFGEDDTTALNDWVAYSADSIERVFSDHIFKVITKGTPTQQECFGLALSIRTLIQRTLSELDLSELASIFDEKSSHGDLVTEADRKIETALAAGLTTMIDLPVVGEEGKAKHLGLTVDDCWVIDPIDGTTNLVGGLDHSAVCVALAVEGEVVVGVVHDIFKDETFIAVKGAGSFHLKCVRSGAAAPRLECKRLYVSEKSEMETHLIGTGFPYDKGRAKVAVAAIGRVVENCRDVRRMGSAALDIAYIACGRLDAYFELDLRVWDIAAASIVLTEAGGTITDWKGNPLVLAGRDGMHAVAASNGQAHDKLVALLG